MQVKVKKETTLKKLLSRDGFRKVKDCPTVYKTSKFDGTDHRMLSRIFFERMFSVCGQTIDVEPVKDDIFTEEDCRGQYISTVPVEITGYFWHESWFTKVTSKPGKEKL